MADPQAILRFLRDPNLQTGPFPQWPVMPPMSQPQPRYLENDPTPWEGGDFSSANATPMAIAMALAGAKGGMKGQRVFWHGAKRAFEGPFQDSTAPTDTLGPATYLTEHKAAAQHYADEGLGGGAVKGPLYVKGNIVEPDTIIPWRLNPDGTTQSTAPARMVLSFLNRGLIDPRNREPWGAEMTPAAYAREFMKRRGVDAYDSGGGHEVAVYDPANISTEPWDKP